MLAEKALEVCSMLLPRSVRKSKPAHTQGCSHMLQSPFHVSLGNSDRTKSKLERTMCLREEVQQAGYACMKGARVHCSILCITSTEGAPLHGKQFSGPELLDHVHGLRSRDV